MNTVRVQVDTTDGRRIVADVEVLVERPVGCGCTLIEAVRPGPETEHTRRWRKNTGRPPMVHILTGCAVHPDDRWHGEDQGESGR